MGPKLAEEGGEKGEGWAPKKSGGARRGQKARERDNEESIEGANEKNDTRARRTKNKANKTNAYI